MPRHYPAELRRRTFERMLAGEEVKDLSTELGLHNVTLYKWRRQSAHRRRGETGPQELRGRSPPCRPPAEVPGCPRAEQPGLLRALRLPDRRLTARPTTTPSSESPTTGRSVVSSWPTPTTTQPATLSQKVVHRMGPTARGGDDGTRTRDPLLAKQVL